MVRFSIRKKFCNLQVGRIIENKTEMQFFYSIGPKIGTSVAPPSEKSTERGLMFFQPAMIVNDEIVPKLSSSTYPTLRPHARKVTLNIFLIKTLVIPPKKSKLKT